MIEQTLILIKPDGVQRGLIGEITKRFEQRGLKIIGMKMLKAERTLAEKHYNKSIAEKYGEKVRENLLKYLIASPVIAMVIQGSNAIATVRKIVGNTYPGEADIGTIRGDFCHVSKRYTKNLKKALPNLVHASENKQDAESEIKLWFSDNEIQNYNLAAEEHLF